MNFLFKMGCIFKGQKDWVNKRKQTTQKMAPVLMKEVLMKIRGRAQTNYLIGPYPIRLRVITGNLRRNIYIDVSQRNNDIIQGDIGVRAIANYGRKWEDKSREGQYFKNRHPQYRPFIRPAYTDLLKEIIKTFQNKIAKE